MDKLKTTQKTGTDSVSRPAAQRDRVCLNDNDTNKNNNDYILRPVWQMKKKVLTDEFACIHLLQK